MLVLINWVRRRVTFMKVVCRREVGEREAKVGEG